MPTFDGPNLIITLDSGTGGVLSVDVEPDLYSEWKEWAKMGDNGKYPPAFDIASSQPLTAGIESGAYFFLRNDYGWRIKPPEEDIDIYVVGNLLPRDASLPMQIPTTGAYTTAIFGLQPITQNVDTILESSQDTSYLGEVHVDTIDGTSGTAYPYGTASKPVNNLADALVIAARVGIKTIALRGYITLTQDFVGWVFKSANGIPGVHTNGYDVTNARFQNIRLHGSMTGTNVHALSSEFEDFSGFSGRADNCAIIGTTGITLGSDPTAETTLVRCYSGVPGGAHANIHLTSMTASDSVGIRGWIGGLTVYDMTAAFSTSIDVLVGTIVLDSTCTAGSPVVRGIGKLTDNSGGGCTPDVTGFLEVDLTNSQLLDIQAKASIIPALA